MGPAPAAAVGAPNSGGTGLCPHAYTDAQPLPFHRMARTKGIKRKLAKVAKEAVTVARDEAFKAVAVVANAAADAAAALGEEEANLEPYLIVAATLGSATDYAVAKLVAYDAARVAARTVVREAAEAAAARKAAKAAAKGDMV